MRAIRAEIKRCIIPSIGLRRVLAELPDGQFVAIRPAADCENILR